MTGGKTTEAYAEEVVQRFQAWTQWAIEHWPGEQPLTEEDFAAARRELHALLGARLTQEQAGSAAPDPAAPPEAGGEQYVPLNPAPWP